jgi:hypothetical protein
VKFLVAILALSACAGSANRKVDVGDVTRAPSDSWATSIKKWTRHGHIIHDFDETLQLDATLHSPELRSAYIEKWIVMYHVGAEEAARLRSQWMTEIADVWELHIECSAHDYAQTNLAGTKSPWRVVLVDDQGNEMLARDIGSSGLNREVEIAMYPYAALFSRGWRVRFPRMRSDGTPFITDQTKWIALRIAGPAGLTDLTWTLK